MGGGPDRHLGKLGKRGVSRILLGSVAERIVEFARIPVLVAGE
ncbi:universal stress protein [Thermodesulfobacteriota bacterium B35]